VEEGGGITGRSGGNLSAWRRGSVAGECISCERRPLRDRFPVQIRGIRLTFPRARQRGAPFLFNRHFAPNIISLART